MTAEVTTYSALITSEHDDKLKFVATVELLASGSVDQQNLLSSLPGLYDFEAAVGVQLDSVGQWIGLGRYQFVPSLGTVTLDDDDYRVLLRAKILANHWDGGMESLNTILAQLFPGAGLVLFAVDNQDMSFDLYLTAGVLSSLQLALLSDGLLVPKPEGVRLNGIIDITGPLFGLDHDDTMISGLDIGAFPTFI